MRPLAWMVAGAALALGVLAGCDRAAVVAGIPPKPLGAADQRVAVDKLLRAFTEVCLTQTDAKAATRALVARGWPAFNTVWNDANSEFYAATPTPASPPGLYVIGDLRRGGWPITDISCTGHYPAAGVAPLLAAMEARFGPSRPGPATEPAARAWTFRMVDGVRTDSPVDLTALGLPSATTLSGMRPGEAVVFAQVFYNAKSRDAASYIGVSRPLPR